MEALDQTTWVDRLSAHLLAAGLPLSQVQLVAAPMYPSARLLSPEHAAETYLYMMLSSGMVERRAQWRERTAELSDRSRTQC